VAVKRAQQIRQQGDRRKAGEHDRNQKISGGMRRVRRGRQASADHPEHDRAHRQVLVAPGALVEELPC
jgi:hypothetical protein